MCTRDWPAAPGARGAEGCGEHHIDGAGPDSSLNDQWLPSVHSHTRLHTHTRLCGCVAAAHARLFQGCLPSACHAARLSAVPQVKRRATQHTTTGPAGAPGRTQGLATHCAHETNHAHLRAPGRQQACRGTQSMPLARRAPHTLSQRHRALAWRSRRGAQPPPSAAATAATAMHTCCCAPQCTSPSAPLLLGGSQPASPN